MRLLPLWLPAGLLAGLLAVVVYGSDHDDGENANKERALNLTDLYVFREGDQTGVPGDNNNLIFIMCANPRSVARQQYYWATNARYEFHVSRVPAGVDEVVTAADDVVLRFEFGAPDTSRRQPITVTAIRDGQQESATVRSDNGLPLLTRPLAAAEPASVPAADLHPVSLLGSTLTVFSGLREDPFFFDVEQFFRIRAGAPGIGLGPAAGPRTLDTALDFTKGYNVNAIVVRVPITFLQGAGSATTFDVWETISVRQ
jgi:hypothetical protein